MSKKKKETLEENRIEEEQNKPKGSGGYFARKICFAILFTGCLLGFSAYNMVTKWEVFRDSAQETVSAVLEGKKTLRQGIGSLESTMSSELTGRMHYIETFSYVQKVLDKREIKNFAYIKDETGSLHYASFYRNSDEWDLFEYAMRVKRLQDYVSKSGTDVIFVVAPSKFVADDNRLLHDMPVNDPQVRVDELLFYLNRLGVETLDLNRYIPNEEVPYEEAFFRTDHHWSIPAAFNATEILVKEMNERFGYELDASEYLNKDNFRKEVYKQGMFGSMGRGSGANFAGLDDMTAYFPKFQMEFTRRTIGEDDTETKAKGDIVGTLLELKYLGDRDIYRDSQYSLYLSGLRTFESITNESNPDGLKVFMIRDSYFSPVITFMAPMVGQIDAVWSLEDSRSIDIEQYVRNNQFDCIIIEIYPYNIENHAFQYFREEEE